MLLASGGACSDLPRARSVSLLAPSQPSREVVLEGKSRTALDGSRWVSPLKVPQNAVLQFSMAVLGTPSAGLPETEFLIEIEVDDKRSRAFRETLAAQGGFNATRPNELWVSDLTYIATWRGFVGALGSTDLPRAAWSNRTDRIEKLQRDIISKIDRLIRSIYIMEPTASDQSIWSQKSQNSPVWAMRQVPTCVSGFPAETG